MSATADEGTNLATRPLAEGACHLVFRCSLCGLILNWTQETGLWFDRHGGDPVLPIDIEPHTCDDEALRDMCTYPDGTMSETEYEDVKTRASKVGW